MAEPKNLTLSKQALQWAKDNGKGKEVEAALALRQAYRSARRPNSYISYTDEQLTAVARVHQERLKRVQAEISRRAAAKN